MLFKNIFLIHTQRFAFGIILSYEQQTARIEFMEEQPNIVWRNGTTKGAWP